MLAVLLALVAACSNATSNVIQRITNKEEKGVKTLSLKLVKDLLHRPLWFAGIAAVTLSFVLQASALRFGPLAMVEPILVCELPLTFVGAAIVLHAPLGRREWGAAAAMTGGLAMLLYFLDAHGGEHGTASALTWTIGLAVSEGIVAAAVVAGLRSSGDRRSAFYGFGTGVQFGTTAALMKGTVGLLSSGPVRLFTSWETYAMVVGGIIGMFLMQNAMQAGKIVAAQPGITLMDPVVAIVWGIVGFGEKTSSSPVSMGLAVLGFLVMIGGGVLLSRSPILEHPSRREPAREPVTT